MPPNDPVRIISWKQALEEMALNGWTLPTNAVVTINPGDTEIGAVELKNATNDDRAKIAAATAISGSDFAVAVQAAILGVDNGAAVITDADGTLQQYLRGLVKLWATGGLGVTVSNPFGGQLVAGSATIGKLISPSFSVSDSLTRPNNAGPYAANQAINMDGTISEVAYTGLVVTVKCTGHGLPVGDSCVTIALVNTGASLTHVDGNWVATYIDADHFRFTVAIQPTGTTPQTGLTIAHAVAKQFSLNVAGVTGGGIILTDFKVSLPGKGMTGAVRAYFDTAQVSVLVDATTYPLLLANSTYRKFYIDLYPVTENASSDCTIAKMVDGAHVIKCEVGDTRIYPRLVAQAVGVPAAVGVVSVMASGLQLLG